MKRPARSPWCGVLWDAHRRRLLPTTTALDAALARGWNLFRACSDGALYHLPTVEWIDGVVALVRRLGVDRVVEAGAGDGFVTRCLRERGLHAVACDDGSWTVGPPEAEVVPIDAFKFVSELNAAPHLAPELVIWCWAPIGSAAAAEPNKVARIVPRFLSVGEDFDCATSHPDEELPYERLPALDAVTRCQTDYTGMLHGRNYLFRTHHERLR